MSRNTEQEQNIEHYDVLIIGGGINGAGIAREASAAGFNVCVCDSGDFGGGTSSASTKLIHGGLRYLEHYEFRLVREALLEREVLWEMAPHIIRPMRFVLPHHDGLRPKWLLRLGLFIYDNIGGRKRLPATKSLNLEADDVGKPLRKEFTHGFEYSDCWVEDSRLVILNLRDAEEMGAKVLPRTRVNKAKYGETGWRFEVVDSVNEEPKTITSSMVVNAAGPWVDGVLRQVFGLNNARNVRLVKGSHIVVPKKFDHDKAYIFQNSDERVIFAIPYEEEYTLIGTTDVEQEDLTGEIKISDEEIEYLCLSASEYFREPVDKADVVWTYSGVRPLFDDGASKAQEATRDYVIRREKTIGNNSLINVFGGKITTFRKLAMQIVAEVEKSLGARVPNTNIPSCFKGGEMETGGQKDLVASLANKYRFADQAMIERLVSLYGTEARNILDGTGSISDLGQHFGLDLYEREVQHLVSNEWAMTAEDVLFRRTKLGIRIDASERKTLDSWMVKNRQLAGVE